MIKNFLIFLIGGACFFIPWAVFAKLPNDPFVSQWFINDLGLEKAWDYTIGSKDVIVAVIDNGFDTFHPDLYGNIWKNEDEIEFNGIDDDNNGYIDDRWGWNFVPADYNKDGEIDKNEEKGFYDPRPSVRKLQSWVKNEGVYNHGSIVAGIIGAVGNNNIDGTGINWNVKMMNLKVLDNTGTGVLEPLAGAIYYAVDNGAHIINISMVGSDSLDKIAKAIDYAYNKGVVVVAAAGNNSQFLNSLPLFPICSDNDFVGEKVIGVSAIGEDHRLANFSNYGSHCIDITAPGVNIRSTLRYSPEDNLVDEYSKQGWNGTSFSAPFVSGAAALIKSIKPDWKAPEIYTALLTTVKHTVGQDEDVYANLFGSGLLQIDKAIEYALNFKEKIIPKSQKGSSVQTKTGEFLVVAPEYNEIQKMKKGQPLEDARKHIRVAGISNIISFVDVDKQNKYLTTKRNKENNIFYIYNSDWDILSSFDLEYRGEIDVTVGNVIGGENPEVIISSVDGDNFIYIYNLSGELMGKVEPCRGVEKSRVEKIFIDLVFDFEKNKNKIVAVCDLGSLIKIKEFLNLKEVKNFDFDNIKNISDLVVTDLDFDNNYEYLLSGQKDNKESILILNNDGDVLNFFNVYFQDYNFGINLFVFDYDGDGSLDIVASPKEDGSAVIVFDNSGYKIDEWLAFGRKTNGNIFILPLK